MTKEEIEQMMKSALDESNKSTSKTVEEMLQKFSAQNSETRKQPVEENIQGDEKLGFKSLGEFAQSVYKSSKPGATMDVRLKAPTGMNEADGVDGGFLVQRDIAAGLLEATFETGIVAPRCTSIPISARANGLMMYGIDDKNRTDGSRWGGILAYWENEANQMTGSRPKFREMDMRLRKLTGLCYVTDDLLEDSEALGAYLSLAFQKEFNFKIDDAIINGKGQGQPLGILNSPALLTIAAESGQSANTINSKNIAKMFTAMPLQNRKNAIWILDSELEAELMHLTLDGSNGRIPVYLPPNGFSKRPYGTLLGSPAVPIEHMNTFSSAGDIAYCDFSEYLLIKKGGVRYASSIHLRFDYNESVLRFTLRIDGQPMRSAPITQYKSNKQLSPFITLGARTG